MTDKEIISRISELSIELKIPAFRTNMEMRLLNAATEKQTTGQVVLAILEQESARRSENRRIARIRTAGFPQYKYLEDLHRESLPKDCQKVLAELETLQFIAEGRNIIMGGSPGTGKSHVATALAISACQQGLSVYFTTVPRLLTQIRESHSTRTLRSLELKFEKYDLVVCDEFGYLSYDKQGAEMLFNHLSLRTGTKSTIITSNTPFDKWHEFFANEQVLTAALLDRLTHRAHLINMNGPSFRLKETKAMLNK